MDEKKIFIAVATIGSYSVARETLLASLPTAVLPRTLLVYAKEDEEDAAPRSGEGGVLEIRIRHNIYEYGLFVGLQRAFDAGVLPADAEILLLHDTCRAGEWTWSLLQQVVRSKTTDLYFLSDTGQCNLCIVNRAAVAAGYAIFKDMMTVPKMTAIMWEWQHHHRESPKGFPGVTKAFSALPSQLMGTRRVYSDIERHVLYYPALDLEKYYINVNHEGQHAQRP